MGSKLSMLHTVPPTMAVWLQAAISILSKAADAEAPGLTSCGSESHLHYRATTVLHVAATMK